MARRAATVPRKRDAKGESRRWVTVCPGCDLLFDTARAHTTSCSPRCRSRLHRRPELLAPWTTAARLMRVEVVDVLKAEAVRRLRPDLADQFVAGEVASFEDVREEIVRAFGRLALEVARERRCAP